MISSYLQTNQSFFPLSFSRRSKNTNKLPSHSRDCPLLEESEIPLWNLLASFDHRYNCMWGARKRGFFPLDFLTKNHVQWNFQIKDHAEIISTAFLYLELELLLQLVLFSGGSFVD